MTGLSSSPRIRSLTFPAGENEAEAGDIVQPRDCDKLPEAGPPKAVQPVNPHYLEDSFVGSSRSISIE